MESEFQNGAGSPKTLTELHKFLDPSLKYAKPGGQKATFLFTFLAAPLQPWPHTQLLWMPRLREYRSNLSFIQHNYAQMPFTPKVPLGANRLYLCSISGISGTTWSPSTMRYNLKASSTGRLCKYPKHSRA